MRVIKGLVLFCFSMVTLNACFDPPEFSNKPRIEFKSIKFRDVEGANEELILTLDFKDGNGDLGLSPTEDTEYPYNGEFYYLADGTGNITPMLATRVEQDGIIYTILNYCPPGSSSDPNNPNYCQRLSGTVVTNKTRTMPNYGHLPAYDPDFSCLNYKRITSIVNPDGSIESGVLVLEENLDASHEREKEITVEGITYQLISDLLYYTVNPNTYNIEVRFWQFENGEYVEYDWYKFNDCQNFFGRFETSASSEYPDRPIEGTLEYTMENSSFAATFGSRAIKVSVLIRDRALNVSNTVESPIFELNEIEID